MCGDLVKTPAGRTSLSLSLKLKLILCLCSNIHLSDYIIVKTGTNCWANLNLLNLCIENTITKNSLAVELFYTVHENC